MLSYHGTLALLADKMYRPWLVFSAVSGLKSLNHRRIVSSLSESSLFVPFVFVYVVSILVTGPIRLQAKLRVLLSLNQYLCPMPYVYMLEREIIASGLKRH